MTIPYPSDMPEVVTGPELVNLLVDADADADSRARRPITDEEMADRHAYYEDVAARAAKYRRVRTRDAGQTNDVAVCCGHGRTVYYRPVRAQKDGETDVMPLPAEAIRRTFSEGMQRALWGCVA